MAVVATNLDDRSPGASSSRFTGSSSGYTLTEQRSHPTMAQSSSSQDLLNLLMGGGAASSSLRPAGSSEKQAEDHQLDTPTSQSRPAPRSLQSREATPSGRDSLEALFSSLRESAPRNSNISPSAVSYAERQNSTAPLRASSGSPSRPAEDANSSAPPLDNVQGRNLLLSMLNVRSPQSQENPPAIASMNATQPAEASEGPGQGEQRYSDTHEESSDRDEHETGEAPSQREFSSTLDATLLEEAKSADHHAGSEHTAPAASTSKASTEPDASEGDVQTHKEATVREASPDGHDTTAAIIPKLDEINIRDILEDAVPEQLTGKINGQTNATPGGVDDGSQEILDPLHELDIKTGSAPQTSKTYVHDHVPISRFTSPDRYTKGRQIAVNGLIAYGTRAGRVRVIDPDTGARLIKKLHSGLATDMDMSTDFVCNNNGGRARRLVTCHNNELKVWRIPASFDGDDAANHIECEFSLERHISIDSVLFNPANADFVAFTASTSTEVYLLDLSKQIGLSCSTVSFTAEQQHTLAIFRLPSRVSSLAWSPSGSVLAGISLEGSVGLFNIETREYLRIQLGKRDDALGPITQIALLQEARHAYPTALLVASARGLLLDIYDLARPGRPASRVRLDEDDPAGSTSGGKGFGRASLFSCYNTIFLSASTETRIHALQFSLPREDLSPGTLSDFAAWCRRLSPESEPEPQTQSMNGNVDIKRIPHFLASQIISTPHKVLQMITTELGGRPGVFYLHADGFEQISLDLSFFDVRESTGTDAAEANLSTYNGGTSVDLVTAEAEQSIAGAEDVFLRTFDSSVQDLPGPVRPVTVKADTLDTQGNLNGTPIASEAPVDGMLEVFQQLLAQQNVAFSQMLAAQQRLYEAQYEQFSRDMAALRQAQADPFTHVSRAIRTELRENLLPVIASALSEIGSASSTSHGQTSSLSSFSQQEHLLQRCTETMGQLFNSFTRQLAPAITEALSGTLERHLANLIIGQAEQGDTMVQMRAIMLAEQMKSEQARTSLEADMQSIKAQISEILRLQAVNIANSGQQVPSASYSHAPLLEAKSVPASIQTEKGNRASELSNVNNDLQRPSTPNAAYEDMFLHALIQNADPLKALIDDGPSSRMDRVLPYDGQPRITAPAFLALCMRLAQDFDNDLPTLDAGNERLRLAWILASLRASKWARSDPQIGAYLPRVFTQVMHSLNKRKQKLLTREDREELAHALQLADELSGLW